MIKGNKQFFKSILIVNNYIKTFTFKKNCFQVQIKTIKYCKTEFTMRSTAYAKLIVYYFDNKL